MLELLTVFDDVEQPEEELLDELLEAGEGLLEVPKGPTWDRVDPYPEDPFWDN